MSSKKQFSDYYNKNIDFVFDDNNPWTAINQGATCCNNKHQTFYGAITKSPQWKAWYQEQTKRFSELRLNKKTKIYEGKPTFDIDEVAGIGAIGDRHLQEFFKFIAEVFNNPLNKERDEVSNKERNDATNYFSGNM